MTTKRQWAWTAGGVVLVAALFAGVAVWTTGHGDGKVTIDLNLPEYQRSEDGVAWTPSVINGTDRDLTDAELEISVSSVGENPPPIQLLDRDDGSEDLCMDEDGSPADPGCLESAEAAKKPEQCDIQHSDDLREVGKSATCTGDVAAGDQVPFPLTLSDYELQPVAHDEKRPHPKITSRAELNAGGRELATATDELSIEYPAEYERVTFSGVPAEVTTDHTESDAVGWSFTITNDTERDLRDAELNIEALVEAGAAAIATDHTGCGPEGSPDPVNAIVCGGVDIPAGDSLTVDMRIFAATEIWTPEECRLYVELGDGFAEGAVLTTMAAG